MSAFRYWAVAAPTLLLAGALQESLANRMSVVGSPPDFPLIALSALALLGERRAGTVVGFVAGLLRGVLAGSNLATYAVGRTLLGYGLGWIRFAGLIPNGFVAGLSAAVGTLLTQGVVMVVAHRGPLIPFLTGTILTAMINGALAMPLYGLLRRLIDPTER